MEYAGRDRHPPAQSPRGTAGGRLAEEPARKGAGEGERGRPAGRGGGPARRPRV